MYRIQVKYRMRGVVLDKNKGGKLGFEDTWFRSSLFGLLSLEYRSHEKDTETYRKLPKIENYSALSVF